MFTAKNAKNFKKAKDLLNTLMEIEGVLAINTNSVRTNTYRGAIDVLMMTDAFFETFGGDMYEYRERTNGYIFIGCCIDDIDFHTLITESDKVNERGEIV